jgi:hypothetical protein
MVSGWGGSIGPIVPMLILLEVLLTNVPGQFAARATGSKKQFSSCAYRQFLFAPIQPLIYVVLLTVAYAITSSADRNPAMFPWVIYSALGMASMGTWIGQINDQQTIWSQNQSLSSATLAFLIISWIGVAGLGTINLLSYLGIRPKFGAEQPAETQEAAPPPA